MEWNVVKNYPAYLCTIKKENERTEFALKQLDKVGITDITIVYGIDARTSSGEAKVIKKCKKYNIPIQRFTKYGEAALFCAFYEALTHFLTTDHTHMLWFEDDIILHYDIDFTVFEKSRYKHFNLTYLGGGFADKELYKPQYVKNNKYWLDCKNARIYGTHALLLDKKAVKVLLNSKNTAVAIDTYINNTYLSYKNFKRGCVIYPIFKNWEDVYNESDSAIRLKKILSNKEYRKITKPYRLSFNGNIWWGIFFQRNISTVLQIQRRFK